MLTCDGRWGSEVAEDFQVRGADQFDRVARAMRAAGQGDLLKEMTQALKRAVKPVTPASRARARQILPQRNGLADRIARAPQRTTARAGNTSTTVRVTVAGKKSGAATADAGTIRHPVFGRPGSFVTQRVRPGWFTDTVEAEREGMQANVVEVLNDYTQRLARQLDGG